MTFHRCYTCSELHDGHGFTDCFNHPEAFFGNSINRCGIAKGESRHFITTVYKFINKPCRFPVNAVLKPLNITDCLIDSTL